MRLDFERGTQGQELVSAEWTSPEEEEAAEHGARVTKARELACQLQVGLMPEVAARQKQASALEALVAWEKLTQEQVAEGPAAEAMDQEAADMKLLKREKGRV